LNCDDFICGFILFDLVEYFDVFIDVFDLWCVDEYCLYGVVCDVFELDVVFE